MIVAVCRIEPENNRHDRSTQHDPCHAPGEQERHAENAWLDPVDKERADEHGGERQKRKQADHAHQITRSPPDVLSFGTLFFAVPFLSLSSRSALPCANFSRSPAGSL